MIKWMENLIFYYIIQVMKEKKFFDLPEFFSKSYF